MKLSAVVPCVVISGAAIVVIGVMPIVAGIFVERFGLGLDQVGWVLSTESIGIAAGTALAYFLSPRGSWRTTVLLGALLAAGANLLTALPVGFATLLLLRFCAGLSAGVVYSVVIYILGRADDPGRAFAGVVLTQSIVFAAYAKVLPGINVYYGNAVAIASIAAWFALIAALAPALPKSVHNAPADVARPMSASVATAVRGAPLGLLALLGLLAFLLGVFSFWGFVERLGVERGLSDSEVGQAIFLGLAAGVVAAVFAVMVGDRLGRSRMAAIACLAVLAALPIASFASDARSYGFALVLFNVGWPLGVAYFMSLAAHHDYGGVFSRLIPVAQVLSGIAAPAIVAVFIRDGGAVIASIVSAGFASAGLVLAGVIGRAAAAIPQVSKG